jgi:hypothetical protein
MAQAQLEQYEAARQDTDDLREMFDKVFRALIQYSIDRDSHPLNETLQRVLQEDISASEVCLLTDQSLKASTPAPRKSMKPRLLHPAFRMYVNRASSSNARRVSR